MLSPAEHLWRVAVSAMFSLRSERQLYGEGHFPHPHPARSEGTYDLRFYS